MSLQPPDIKRGQSIRRTGTRKGPAPARKGKTYDIVQQGLKQLYPLDEKTDRECNLDIVLVPGLGADPKASWESDKTPDKTSDKTSTPWNWTTSADGLVRDFPKARILLFMYESAWVGNLKSKNSLDNIAMTLLVGLRSKRETCKSRPLVLIGHSMGGLVIAKAVIYTHTRREKFPDMFEAVAGTIFFGTPFGGAAASAWAAMAAPVLEKLNAAAGSELLKLMVPGEAALLELRREFVRLMQFLVQQEQVVCFWEQELTNFMRKAGMFSVLGMLVPNEVALVVSKEAAILDGAQDAGLKCAHSDLVRFDGPKDERWAQAVREYLYPVLKAAPRVAKARSVSARGIDWDMFTSIKAALGAVQVDRKRRDVAKTVSPSSWIADAAEFRAWITDGVEKEPTTDPVHSLWVCGREGRGKTGAALAALNKIETAIKESNKPELDQEGPVLAYFFCEASTDYGTAEDLLISLVSQLMTQRTALASHAKAFVKKKGQDGVERAEAQQTVENLWQCLQSMLYDDAIGPKVYLVINNVHVLPKDVDSTRKFLRLLNAELEETGTTNSTWRKPSRWFVTSRDQWTVSKPQPGMCLIDLEHPKYQDEVHRELQRHAKAKVTALEVEKKYPKALSYFASSLIGKRAQSVHWIDITCVQLQELSEDSSHLTVRRMLEATPQDLSELLNEAWRQIFAAQADQGEKIQEILRALILAYEEPTEAELGLLAGISTEEEELRVLLEHCKPLVVAKRTVSFMNPAVKAHLVQHAPQLLGLSGDEIKWQHGILAHRCLVHLKENFSFPEAETEDADENEGEEEEDDQDEDQEEDESESDSDDSDTEEDDWDSESEEEPEPEADILKDLALAYAVKYWLRHGSKATDEFADDLSLDHDLWEAGSLIRRRWLVEYARLTSDLEYFDFKTFSALHVASSVGFRQLVTSLISHDHEGDVHVHDTYANTPLHLAAWFGRPNIIDTLLHHGAQINDQGTEKNDSPLHMAAERGHVKIMEQLILAGAHPNAFSATSGLVINSAISSGKQDAIELLVRHGVALTSSVDDVKSPLAQAAAMADISILEYLIEQYGKDLAPEEYGKALVSAAEAGRLDIVRRLLQFPHEDQDYQWAFDGAAKEANWDVVDLLLEYRSDLDCDEAFFQAATGYDDKDKVLDALWEYTQGGISIGTIDSCLYQACDNQKESTVAMLLEKFNADPNATGEEYGNALTAAAYDGREDILQLLLDRNADVNSPNGWALQTAAAEGHEKIVRTLLDHHANVNAMADEENFPAGTALQAATENGQAEIVALLLAHNADPNLGGGDDAPPVLAAAGWGHEGILSQLVSAGARVNVSGRTDGATPLIQAAEYIGGTNSLRTLLDAGADINAVDHEGRTALVAAAAMGDTEVVQYLLDHGADVMHTTTEGTNALKAALESGDDDCAAALVNQVSGILSAIKAAMDAGDMAVAAVVRGATMARQALDYGDGEGKEAGSWSAAANIPATVMEEPQDSFKQAVVSEHVPAQPTPLNPSTMSSNQPWATAENNQYAQNVAQEYGNAIDSSWNTAASPPPLQVKRKPAPVRYNSTDSPPYSTTPEATHQYAPATPPITHQAYPPAPPPAPYQAYAPASHSSSPGTGGVLYQPQAQATYIPTSTPTPPAQSHSQLPSQAQYTNNGRTGSPATRPQYQSTSSYDGSSWGQPEHDYQNAPSYASYSRPQVPERPPAQASVQAYNPGPPAQNQYPQNTQTWNGGWSGQAQDSHGTGQQQYYQGQGGQGTPGYYGQGSGTSANAQYGGGYR